MSQSISFADQQWQRAAGMLQSNPTLVTYHIICMALKHKPPASIIEYMLQLNPKAAGVPKTGPTPLQVAVQSFCSIEVTEKLINACPLALVATNPGSHLDPLSYAKRFRSEEKELIQLLSLPLSHWISEKTKSDDSHDESDDDKTTAAGNVHYGTNSYKPTSLPSSQPLPPERKVRLSPPALNFCVGPAPMATTTSTPPDLFKTFAPSSDNNHGPKNGVVGITSKPQPFPPPPSPPTLPMSSTSFANNHQISQDRQELINVKQLCLAVVRGHKRLSRDLKILHQHDWLSSLQEQNEKQFRTQLIALDMKEKAMRGHLRQVEDRLQIMVKQQVDAFKVVMADAASTTTSASLHNKTNEIQVLEDRLKQLTGVVQDRFRHLQGRVQGVENAVSNKMEQSESRSRYAYSINGSIKFDDVEFDDVKWSPSFKGSGSSSRKPFVAVVEEVSPIAVRTSTYSSSSTSPSAASSASWSSSHHGKKSRQLFPPPPVNPIIFSTHYPFVGGTNDADDDDEVRSLLSEDEVLFKKKPLARRTRLPLWMSFLKDVAFFFQ